MQEDACLRVLGVCEGESERGGGFRNTHKHSPWPAKVLGGVEQSTLGNAVACSDIVASNLAISIVSCIIVM